MKKKVLECLCLMTLNGDKYKLKKHFSTNGVVTRWSSLPAHNHRCKNFFGKAPVTLSRLGGRPLPTLMVGKGLVRSVGGRERAAAAPVRSWEVGELGRGVPDCFELFKTVGSDRE